ncbi:DUF4442 domain-containing protein [Granulosicoccus sp.]|nr:DUF4442 domain-containing protein [Granulosicoccus sp.]
MSAWTKLSGKPCGKWMFSRFLSFKAPYFATISPRFIELRPGYCKIYVRKKRKILNHIGTVHAIAMCNMAELAGGTMTDVTVPPTHRWIPKEMNVKYIAKAETNLYAIAKLDQLPEFADSSEFPISVNVFDDSGKCVVEAVITMWISKK